MASAATTLSQEELPVDFQVEFRSAARAASFGRFDFLETIIFAMASMAVSQWNSDVPAKKFESLYHVAIGIVSNRSGPGLRVKHVIWTLEKIFDYYVNNDIYQSSNFVVHLGSTALGAGNVYSTERDSAAANISDTRIGDLADGSTGDSARDPTLALSNDAVMGTGLAPTAYWQGNTSPIQTLPLRQKSSAPVNLAAEGRVSYLFWYRPNGAIFDDAQVYNATLKLLVKAAEPSSLKETIWPGLTTYNSRDNFTFTMRPVNFALRENLDYFDSIVALASIVSMMAKSGGLPGRFMELDGTLQAGMELIGRFCIDKGDKTELNLQELCTLGQPDGGNHKDGVATA